MHNEVFGEIPGPIDYTSNQHCELSIYKDSICLLVYHHHNRHDDANPIIDVWLLNDDRSWTKVVNLIPTRIELRNVVPTMTCWTVGFWDQDKFIFESENEIIHFDTKTHEFTPLLDKPKQVCDRAALSYKESRVSIKGDILYHMQEFFEEYSEDEDCKNEDSKDDE
ncbi:hypothetical protein BC332_11710 [Capsicum chinense]|nr:hypothetical protein BC332_11710 [Capsicum chinense]